MRSVSVPANIQSADTLYLYLYEHTTHLTD